MIRTVIWLMLCAALVFVASRSDRKPVTIDLGTARYPNNAMNTKVTVQDWAVQERRRRYRLGYAHGAQAVESIEHDHRKLGQRNGFSWTTGDAFRWQLGDACKGREWSCVYTAIFDRSAIDLAPFLDRIHAGLANESHSTAQASRWLLALVQQIPYRLPTSHAFGVLPPALVVSQNWGDCDSKSLLLMELLSRVGIDSILLVSEAHAHALVGIAVPANGSGFQHRGREYSWAETTADAPLGWIHPGLRLPNDWQVIPIDANRLR